MTFQKWLECTAVLLQLKRMFHLVTASAQQQYKTGLLYTQDKKQIVIWSFHFIIITSKMLQWYCGDVLVLPQLWFSLPHCHHSLSLCHLYHLTLAAICLNSTVIVLLCDCNTTVQLPSHFYRWLLYDSSTVPLQLLRQKYKCCAVSCLTTNVLKNLKPLWCY